MRIKRTSFLDSEGALLTKKFVELEKNLKINIKKPSHIYIVIERLLSLNVFL